MHANILNIASIWYSYAVAYLFTAIITDHRYLILSVSNPSNIHLRNSTSSIMHLSLYCISVPLDHSYTPGQARRIMNSYLHPKSN